MAVEGRVVLLEDDDAWSLLPQSGLARLLYTGRDFVIIDFQGDPARTIGERRLKRSALRDVAALIRSFDYAVQSVLFGLASNRGRSPGLIRAEDQPSLAPWATAWYDRVAREFVTEYVRRSHRCLRASAE